VSKLALVMFVLCGCSSISTMHEQVLRSHPPPVRETTLVVEGESYNPHAEDVALLQVLVWGPTTERETFLALTRRGGELGCDAVVRAHFVAGTTRSTATGVCVTWPH
jgi:hypothetical protein